jgi:hypothetical protein
MKYNRNFFQLFSSGYVRIVTFVNYVAKIRGLFVQIFVHSVPKMMRAVSKTGGVSVFRLEENMYFIVIRVKN